MKSIILAISVLFFVGPTFADTISCKNFENATYEGNKKGKGYQGPITIKFTDQCKSTKSGFKIKYKWIGSNGKVVTPGALTFKEEDEVKYKNKAGSKGKVFIEGDKLHWKNVYTGNNYNVHVTKQQ